MIDKFLDHMKYRGWTAEVNEEQKFRPAHWIWICRWKTSKDFYFCKKKIR